MTLENLVRINQLHIEPPDRREFNGLLKGATERLHDAENRDLSLSSRFDLAYSAAYRFALAALRAAGYRTDKRYLVFQCLQHTVQLDKGKVRLFSLCHDRRNRAEYEGQSEVDEALLEELIVNTKELSLFVKRIDCK
jgi:hypothetical protein